MITLVEAANAPWFHSIDFRPAADLISKSRFSPHVPPNWTLFGFYELLQHIDLKDASCLDIGTMDGISSFIMAKRGAHRIVATDIAYRDTFAFGAATLEIDVEYKSGIDLFTMTEALNGEKFDFVLMAGVLYHVFDPLFAISTLRQLVKHQGLAMVETHFLPDEERPVMIFNPADNNGILADNFFWRPSLACIEGMLDLCCFKTISRVITGKRVTYLAKATKPDDMVGCNDITKEIHSKFMALTHYRENIDYTEITNDSSNSSVRLITPPPSSSTIIPRRYVPDVPLQPAWSPSSRQRAC